MSLLRGAGRIQSNLVIKQGNLASHAKEANQRSKAQADESKHGQEFSEFSQQAGRTTAAMLLITVGQSFGE